MFVVVTVCSRMTADFDGCGHGGKRHVEYVVSDVNNAKAYR